MDLAFTLFVIFALSQPYPGLCKIKSATKATTREGKFLVAIVDAPSCQGTGGSNTNVFGVCKPSCLQSNGEAEIGKCANNLGTCCQVTVKPSASHRTPTVVTQSAVTIEANGIADSNSVVEIPRKAGFCQLKINFLSTRLASPLTDAFRYGDCAEERIILSGSPSIPSGSITLCGDLSGQHAYLSYGTDGSSPSDRITIQIQTKSSRAKYSFNLLQIKCNSADIVPDNCLQQFTADSGQVKSFGFPIQLNNQYYTACTKALKKGVTAVQWKECQGQRTVKPFHISGLEDAPAESGNFDCSLDWVTLSPTGDKLCGGGFATTTVPGSSGALSVNLDANEAGHAYIVYNVPPNFDCSTVKFDIPVFTCSNGVTQGLDFCFCSLAHGVPALRANVSVLASESCPTFEGSGWGFQCFRASSTLCQCDQRWEDYDRKNTGFCLEFKHIY